jgi:uncharacterized membrane protein YobD (UPF0266 family)
MQNSIFYCVLFHVTYCTIPHVNLHCKHIFAVKLEQSLLLSKVSHGTC